MKFSTRTQNKMTTKKTVSSRTASTKRGTVSKIARSTKRYGKQTLRDLLLSKTFHTSFKILLGLMISGSALYGAYAFIGNTLANDVVVSKSEILVRIAKHVELPKSEPEAVVRVQDAINLKKQNDFYSNIKEGDYIVMYQDLAIIYDLRNDAVVALKKTGDR
jgi:hypothetical protein